MTRFEKWLAVLTLLGAGATALAAYVKSITPVPVPVASCSSEERCRTVLVLGGWWLSHCRIEETAKEKP